MLGRVKVLALAPVWLHATHERGDGEDANIRSGNADCGFFVPTGLGHDMLVSLRRAGIVRKVFGIIGVHVGNTSLLRPPGLNLKPLRLLSVSIGVPRIAGHPLPS